MLDSFIMPAIVVFVSAFFNIEELNIFILTGTLIGNSVVLISIIHNLLFGVLKINSKFWLDKLVNCAIILSFFIVFFSVCAIGAYVFHLIFFNHALILLRFCWAVVSVIVFFLLTRFIFYMRRDFLCIVEDKNILSLNYLSCYLFFLFVFSVFFLLCVYLPIKYLILFMFMCLICSNHIYKFYNVSFKKTIENSSYFSLLVRFSNIAPLIFISESAAPGFCLAGSPFILMARPAAADLQVMAVEHRPFNRSFSSSRRAVPITSLVRASLEYDRQGFGDIVRRTGAHKRLGVMRSWHPSHAFVHDTFLAIRLSNLKNQYFAKISDISPDENALIVPAATPVQCLIDYLHKFKNPLLEYRGESWVLHYAVNQLPYQIPSHMQQTINDLYFNESTKGFFIESDQQHLGKCYRFNLGDLFTYNADTNIIKEQLECKSVSKSKLLEKSFSDNEKKYIGLSLQFLDVESKKMYWKDANSNSYNVTDLNVELDDQLITEKLEKNFQVNSELDDKVKLEFTKQVAVRRFLTFKSVNKYED